MKTKKRQTDIAITEVDLRSLTDTEIEELNAFANLLKAEARPEDPPTPVELTAASVRNIPEVLVLHEFWARTPDGGLVGMATGSFSRSGENPHLLNVDVDVHPDHRREGIGTQLLRRLVDLATKKERHLLMGTTSDRIAAGEAFAREVGAEAGSATHTNRLVFADVDRDLVARWIADGPRRAPDYSLIALDGLYPEDMFEDVCDLLRVLNTAPKDDLEMDDWAFDPDEVRQWIESGIAKGSELWTLLARHDPTGQLVGFTEVTWNPKLPQTVWQLGTGVRPEHRGHALGKWLKAEMLERVLRERPEAKDIRTGNADSNDAMLGINRALGFTHYIAEIIWQVKTERAREYLDATAARPEG